MDLRGRCKHCGKIFQRRPQNPDQQHCSQSECQKARKREWQRRKLKEDPEYRENQRHAARRWRERNPDYWRTYRKEHEDYTINNRVQQRRRNLRHRRSARADDEIANMDTSKSQNNILSGLYRLSPVVDDGGRGIANMDASIVKIHVIQDSCS